MPELYIALLQVDGEFVYGGTRADSVVAAVSALGEERELEAIEWLQTYDSLPPGGQQSEPVQSVLALLEDDDVVLDWANSSPAGEEPDPADPLRELVENWIDGAAERVGDFELGDHALVAELRFDDEVELGWAYHGSLRGAKALFQRASDAVDD